MSPTQERQRAVGRILDDPDEPFHFIPVEKGFSFMRYLESIFGNEKFEKFFKGNKVGCVFPMVISSDFRMGKHTDDDWEKDAPNFT